MSYANWSPTAYYLKDDVVYDNNEDYIALSPNFNVQPSVSPLVWTLLSPPGPPSGLQSITAGANIVVTPVPPSAPIVSVLAAPTFTSPNVNSINFTGITPAPYSTVIGPASVVGTGVTQLSALRGSGELATFQVGDALTVQNFGGPSVNFARMRYAWDRITWQSDIGSGGVTYSFMEKDPSPGLFALSNISTINGNPIPIPPLVQVFQYAVPSNTSGGVAPGLGFYPRPLNTGVPALSGNASTVIPGMSLNPGTYEITVPAGTYIVTGGAGGLMTTAQAQVWSTVTSNTVLLGTSVGDPGRTIHSTFTGPVTGPDVLMIQFAGSAPGGTFDWGQPGNFGVDEVYAQIQFVKIV